MGEEGSGLQRGLKTVVSRTSPIKELLQHVVHGLAVARIVLVVARDRRSGGRVRGRRGLGRRQRPVQVPVGDRFGEVLGGNGPGGRHVGERAGDAGGFDHGDLLTGADEIAGRTLLEITLARLRAFGIREVIINVHHFADLVLNFLKANDNFGMRIEISREEELLDTGGGVVKALTVEQPGKFEVSDADTMLKQLG